MKQQTRAAGRRRYSKPRLRVIELAAREVLGLGCKTVSGGNNFGTSPCVGGSCASSDGS